MVELWNRANHLAVVGRACARKDSLKGTKAAKVQGATPAKGSFGRKTALEHIDLCGRRVLRCQSIHSKPEWRRDFGIQTICI